ncbi:TPA: DsbE family thiol:disulfide interchange protein [Enterobacter hormaechei subsp. steigerwaltii]|nr:DsbE family thiol:disulfide interchange protein [Enterobacter hormaechei subsp. steigerwaltii]
MNPKLLSLPLILFVILAMALMWQLMRNEKGDAPGNLESALIGKPLPEFELTMLFSTGEKIDASALLNGKPLLINFWATWCPTCRAEHKYLRTLSEQGVRIVGINYKDKRQKAQIWLQTLGDPYGLTLFDGDGMFGLDLGVYGAPETFLIDGKGIIRYRHAGEMNETVWMREIQPLWARYSREAK